MFLFFRRWDTRWSPDRFVFTAPPTGCREEKTLFLFHLTKIMYIHVYNTGSFSADTRINSTYHMQTEPGRKKKCFGPRIQGTIPAFLHVLKLYMLYIASFNCMVTLSSNLEFIMFFL